MKPHELAKLITAKRSEINDLRASIEDLQRQLDVLEKPYKERHPEIGMNFSVSNGTYKLVVDGVKGVRLLETGGFGKPDPDDRGGVYGVPTDAPVGWTYDKFIGIAQQIADDAGTELSFYAYRVRTEPGIGSISALRLLHPEADVQLVEKGRVWYVGWDCPDYYYTAHINGELHAFWSDDAHGGCICHQAKFTDRESWNKFQNFLSRAASTSSGW